MRHGQDSSGPSVVKYNELATLMDVSGAPGRRRPSAHSSLWLTWSAASPGTDAIVHLMSRDTHLEFGFASICVFFVVRLRRSALHPL